MSIGRSENVQRSISFSPVVIRGGAAAERAGDVASPIAGERMLSEAIERALTRFGEVAKRAGAAHGLNGDDLDEVMQDVRIRLWRAGGTTIKLDSLSAAYIYRAAVSSAIDLIRRRRARRELRLEFDAAAELALGAAATSPPADAELYSADALDAIGDVLATLAPNRQAVVRLYLQSYSREEIAALLRWSEAKTRNLLYRGLEDLRLQLRAKGIAR